MTEAATQTPARASRAQPANVLVVFGITGDLTRVMTFRSLYRLEQRGLRSVWNSNHVACVQITLAEDFGVEDRGHFCDPVGAPRDVVVNHLTQVVATAAMEPPAGGDAETLKDAMAAVFRAMPQADPAHYVRGQYDGYLDMDGVAPDSTTETYAALRLEIDNWRWSGVPFFIRTRKRPPVKQTRSSGSSDCLATSCATRVPSWLWSSADSVAVFSSTS